MSERQAQIEAVFLEALALPIPERAALLARRCDGDSAMRAEIESLLGHHTEGFLKHSELKSAVAPAEDPTIPTGTRIGDYTVRGVLGSGGMGVVYIADQERPHRTVALKVIRRGHGTTGILRRFEHEAEVLGRLQHPGIAQIFEAGVADVAGTRQPFIAMELVKGRMLTEYAVMHRLSVAERLSLMAKICDAIHHAHQRGIIHRDLKPPNILVDDAGQPKVLDFGVARIQDPEFRGSILTTLHTGVGQFIGTLPYMSPEQVSGDSSEVDVRSDVYTLGVVMYQLLTERLPHDLTNRSFHDAARIIRDEPPARLSTANRTLRGDLETMLAMALAKEKPRRYQSAFELGEDIRRYLAGEPILARRDSALYILRKQMRRYKSLVAAGIVALVALVAFLVYAGYKVRVETHLAGVANSRAEALRRSLYSSSIAFAQASYLSNDVQRMRRVLDECPEDLRGWEWRFLRRLSDGSAQAFRAQPAGWGGASLSTTTGAIAAFTIYQDITVWTPAAQRGATEPLRLRTPGPLQNAVINPHGDRVFASDDKLATRVWSIPACAEVWTGAAPGRAPATPIFSPDGAFIVYPYTLDASKRVEGQPVSGVALISAADGRVVRTFPVDANETNSVAIDPEGKRLAAGGYNGAIWVYNLTTGDQIAHWSAHDGYVSGLAFSPDGRALASCSFDATVRTWDPATGAPGLVIRSHENKVFKVAYNPTGRYLASGGTQGVVLVHNAASGALEQRLCGHPDRVGSMYFYPDGRLMTAALEGIVRIWDSLGQPEVPTINTEPCFVGGVSGNGKVAAMMTNSEGRVYDLPNGVVRHQVRLPPCAKLAGVGVNHDGSLVAFPSGPNVSLFETGPGKERLLLSGHTAGVFKTVFDRTGARVASGAWDNSVRAWRTDTGQCIATLLSPVKSDQVGIAFAHDATRIATATSNGHIYIWDLPQDKPSREFTAGTGAFFTLLWSPDDSTLIAPGGDGDIWMWNLADPAGTPRRLPGDQGSIYAAALSPDGSRILVGGFDNNAHLWDLATGVELLSLRGHKSAVTCLAFSADGDRVVSISNDHSMKVWDAPRIPPREPVGDTPRKRDP